MARTRLSRRHGRRGSSLSPQERGNWTQRDDKETGRESFMHLGGLPLIRRLAKQLGLLPSWALKQEVCHHD